MEIEARIQRIESGAEALRIEYEKYFSAVRPAEPSDERSSIRRRITECSATQIVNTALRFRFQSIVARFQSHERLWNETLRKLEASRSPRTTPSAPPTLEMPRRHGREADRAARLQCDRTEFGVALEAGHVEHSARGAR